jgi:hypothetical protein
VWKWQNRPSPLHAETNLKTHLRNIAQARLDARDQQIKQVQDSLNARQTDRGTLVTFGDVLFCHH